MKVVTRKIVSIQKNNRDLNMKLPYMGRYQKIRKNMRVF